MSFDSAVEHAIVFGELVLLASPLLLLVGAVAYHRRQKRIRDSMHHGACAVR